jgi:O-antigen/teichoic acid export membrane protein
LIIKLYRSSSPHPAMAPLIFKNSAIGLVCRILSVAATLCLVPFVVSRVGIAGYGMWETIVSLTGILYLMQSVMSGTLLWWMSQAYGRSDLITLQRASGIGMTYITVVALVSFPLACLGAEYLLPLFKAPAVVQREIVQILPVSVALFALAGGNEILVALAGASQQMGRALIIQTVARMGQYAIACAGLLAGYGLRSMVVGQGVGSIICMVLLIRFLRRLYPTLHFLPLIPTREELRLLYRYMGFMTISGVATVLREQLDKLILAAWATPAWVGYYAIATRLATLILDFNRFFYPHLLTAAGALAARNEWGEVRRLYLKVESSVAICTGFICLLVVGGYDRLLVIWLGSAPPEIETILFLLVLGNSAAVLLTGPPLALCRGVGKIGIETTYLTVSLVLNLGGTLLLVPLMGPLGTVYASTGTALVGGILFLWLFHRNMPMPVSAVRNALFAYSIALLITGMVRAVFSLTTLPPDRWGALVSYVVLLLPASMVYMLALFAVNSRKK